MLAGLAGLVLWGAMSEKSDEDKKKNTAQRK